MSQTRGLAVTNGIKNETCCHSPRKTWNASLYAYVLTSTRKMNSYTQGSKWNGRAGPQSFQHNVRKDQAAPFAKKPDVSLQDESQDVQVHRMKSVQRQHSRGHGPSSTRCAHAHSRADPHAHASCARAHSHARVHATPRCARHHALPLYGSDLIS